MRSKIVIKITLIIISCLSGVSIARAQTVITGTVLNKRGEAADAYVTASVKSGGNIIGFADTDEKGFYRLEFSSRADSVVVIADGMDIDRQAKVVANITQQLNFRVNAKAIQLAEVSVRAKKITQQGDTLNYLVGAYRQQVDRTIGDVLKRMPGIEVSDNGGIMFNGKSISKFYVEDMDLMQGRYGLATNNVNAQDVASVQVLQNHQSVKALQDRSLSDDVAINLKLKDSAKGAVAVNAMAGAGGQVSAGWGLGVRPLSAGMIPIGSNPLWTAELVGMYFGKRRQNMTLYKGNNTGDDVSKELTSHGSGSDGVGLYPYCPMGVVMPSGSGLPQKRSFDNRSNLVTTNHLEKIDANTELALNVAYYNDCIRQEGESGVEYFISNGQRLLSGETLTSMTKLNNLDASLRYCRNAKNAFTANVVRFEGGWNGDDVAGLTSASLTGTAPVDYGMNRVSQHFHRPSLSVSNTLNLIRNYGKHTLNLNFSAGYASRPNLLTVDIDSLWQATSARYEQALTSRHIAGKFHTNYTFHLGLFSLNYGVIANASLHGIETELEGFSPPSEGASVRNDLWYNVYELTFGQYYKFEQQGWRLSFGCPLNLYTQTLDDRIRRDRQSYSRLLVSPTLSAGYEWRDWSGSVNASYYRNVGAPGGIYSGYIMNNYRSFQRSYVERLSETDRIGAGLSIAYRSALNATFVRVNANYGHARDNQIYGYDYYGSTSVVQVVDRKTSADNFSFGFDGSKGFDSMQTTVRAFGGYSYRRSENLIDKQLYPFHSRAVSIGAGVTFTPLSWVNIAVSSGYAWTVSATGSYDDGLAYTIRAATQRINCNFYVNRQITIAVSAEDNYTNLTDKNRHAWFGDLAVKYKLKCVDLELHANNLFNQQSYTRVNYRGLDIYTSTSRLRPLNIIATVRFKLL